MYTTERTKYEVSQDQAAEAWELAQMELAQLVQCWGKAKIAKELSNLPDTNIDMWKDWAPSCDECINWHCARTFKLSDGSLYLSDGFCEVRAAASIEQMPQDYARACQFFKMDCPF